VHEREPAARGRVQTALERRPHVARAFDNARASST
jgi:hypothetical protein